MHVYMQWTYHEWRVEASKHVNIILAITYVRSYRMGNIWGGYISEGTRESKIGKQIVQRWRSEREGIVEQTTLHVVVFEFETFTICKCLRQTPV